MRQLYNVQRSLVAHEATYSVLNALIEKLSIRGSYKDVHHISAKKYVRFVCEPLAHNESNKRASEGKRPKPPPQITTFILRCKDTKHDLFLDVSRFGSVVLMWPLAVANGPVPVLLGCSKGSHHLTRTANTATVVEFNSCQCAEYLARDYGGTPTQFAVMPLSSILSHGRMYETVSKNPASLPFSRFLLGAREVTHLRFHNDSSSDEEEDPEENQKMEVVVVEEEEVVLVVLENSKPKKTNQKTNQVSIDLTMSSSDGSDHSDHSDGNNGSDVGEEEDDTSSVNVSSKDDEEGGEDVIFAGEQRYIKDPEERKICSVLNESQNGAIRCCVALSNTDATPSPLVLLQGPPGTGKTTTISALLQIFRLRQRRVALCASTNKAVAVAMTAFLKAWEVQQRSAPLRSPISVSLHASTTTTATAVVVDVHDYEYSRPNILLVGVEDQVPDNLREFFLHNQADILVKHLKQGKKMMLEMTKHPERVCQMSKNERLRVARTLSACCSLMLRLGKQERAPKTVASAIHRLATNSFAFVDHVSCDLALLLSHLTACLSTIETMPLEKIELLLLNEAQLVCCTLCIAGRYSMRISKRFDVLVVDEAAQPVEAEFLISMNLKPRRCILVGDPRQLSSVVESTMAIRAGFGRSLMSRLLDMGSKKSGASFHMLDTQYRMHPEIALWPNIEFYQGQLKNDPSVLHRSHMQDVPLHFGPLAFIDCHRGMEKRRAQGGSWYNEIEVEEVCAVLNHLGVFGGATKHCTVTILTFYSAQVGLLRRRLRENFGNQNILSNMSDDRQLQRRARLASLKVDTVDSMQGAEADIVLLSFVRSTHRCGFLNDERRLNVSLTRAKVCCVMFGRLESLATSDSPHIASLMKSVKERRLVFKPRGGASGKKRKENGSRSTSSSSSSSSSSIRGNLLKNRGFNRRGSTQHDRANQHGHHRHQLHHRNHDSGSGKNYSNKKRRR